MDDPFLGVIDPLLRLRARTIAEFARHGLKVVEFALAPGLTVDGPHEVHVLAVLGDEVPEVTERDEEFDEVLRSARQAEIEEQNVRAEQDLRDRLSGDDGFL